MKLRNKKTGGIVKVVGFDQSYDEIKMRFVDEDNVGKLYITDSLVTFNSDWEDYKEPKEYWCIDWTGGVNHITVLDDIDKYEKNKKQIGNYFETREEAEKAVEKLKSFSNLKNHEFMFDGWYYGTDGNIVILANAHEFNDMEEQDLTKVFGEKIC